MKRNTLQERIEIIEIHYKNGENLAEHFWVVVKHLDCNKEIGGKIRTVGQVSDVKNKTCARHSRTAENIAAVAESVEEVLSLEEVITIGPPRPCDFFLWGHVKGEL